MTMNPWRHKFNCGDYVRFRDRLAAALHGSAFSVPSEDPTVFIVSRSYFDGEDIAVVVPQVGQPFAVPARVLEIVDAITLLSLLDRSEDNHATGRGR